MKKQLMIYSIIVLVAVVSACANAALYSGIGQNLDVELIDSDKTHSEYLTIYEYTRSVTNKTTATLSDVKLVIPFLWGGSTIGPYDWVDTDNQWHSDVVNGYDGIADGVYVRAVTGVDSAVLSRILMSDTDLPLSITFIGDGSVGTVLPSDHVPAWDIAASLGPGQTVTFKYYLEQEKGSGIGGMGGNLYWVAVPEPLTVLFLAAGALAVLWKRPCPI